MRADVIHTNGLKAHLIGGLAGRIARCPVVWHLRDFPPEGAGGRMLRAAARILPALVIANSNAVAASIPAARVTRLYNPVDLERFRPDVSRATFRRELGIGDAATLRLLGDAELRERLGRAGRRRAEALFGVEAHADEVLAAYRSVIRG